MILLASLIVCGCATKPKMDKTNAEIERLVILALDAQKAGMNDQALVYYDQAITKIDEAHFLSPTDEVTKPWYVLKAQVLYEKAMDKQLIELSKEDLDKQMSLKWWCHILERRGQLEDAEKCWTVYGDAERVTRVIRTRETLKMFTPDQTRFGYIAE